MDDIGKALSQAPELSDTAASNLAFDVLSFADMSKLL